MALWFLDSKKHSSVDSSQERKQTRRRQGLEFKKLPYRNGASGTSMVYRSFHTGRWNTKQRLQSHVGDVCSRRLGLEVRQQGHSCWVQLLGGFGRSKAVQFIKEGPFCRLPTLGFSRRTKTKVKLPCRVQSRPWEQRKMPIINTRLEKEVQKNPISK